MQGISFISGKLQPSKGLSVMTKSSQTTNDIINQVMSQHNHNKIEAKAIAKYFDGGNLFETCRNIWNFIKDNIPYEVEPSDRQTTKTLARILDDAKKGKGSDCKHYSGFTGAILDALGYKHWFYRFAGYSPYSPMPTHVYVVAKDDEGEIYVDAVLSSFDVQKPFKINIDKKPNQMSLYKLSGVDDANVGGLWSSIKKSVDKGFSAINKNVPFVKKIADATGDAAKKIVAGGKTFSLAVPRNAFIVLLKFNVHGWASGLKNAKFDDLKWWVDWFGGNRTDLMNAIKDGAKKKRILGVDDPSLGEPVTISSALASAVPILLKVSDYLKKAEKIADKAEGIANKVSSTAETINSARKAFKDTTGRDATDMIYKKDSGSTESGITLASAEIRTPTLDEANKVAAAVVQKEAKQESRGSINPVYIAAGIGGALLLISIAKKK